MLAGDIHGPRTIRLTEVPEPSLEPDPAEPADTGQVIFQPALACLCGSDLLYFDCDYEEYRPQIGHSLHEMIGTIVETSGKRFRRGDRVLCVPLDQRGLFERFRVSEDRAVMLDPGLSDEQAVLAQPLGSVIHALRKLPNLIDRDVAVVGQGPMGQLFCASLRNLGARAIIAIDPLASRLATSPRMGATHVVHAESEDPIAAVGRITGGKMADLVVEAVGHREQALDLCTDLCRREGRILFFGVPRETVDGIHWRRLFRKNITVHTAVDPDFDRDYPLAMQWIRERRIDVQPIITHRFALPQIQSAFETFRHRRDGALKVFVDFSAR